MNHEDTITIYKDTLTLKFSASGDTSSLSCLPLTSTLYTIACQDKSILCKYSGDKELVLESFSNEQKAISAFTRVTDAIATYHKRKRRTGLLKTGMFWGVYPTLVFLGFLALNAAMTMRQTQPITTLANVQNSAAYAQLFPAEQHKQDSSSQTPVTPESISKTLREGAAKGVYTISSIIPDAPTLYVFSDPSCPSCKKFEQSLADLKRDFTIHIFPVSKIGKLQSLQKASTVLCKTTENRQAAWDQLMQSNLIDVDTCDVGNMSVGVNNKIFSYMGLAGTPSIIHESGNLLPYSMVHSPEAIRTWAASQ